MTSTLDNPLSERELEILHLLATGVTNKEIANRLAISPNTVKVHLRNIYAKINVASRTEASMWAVHNGLLNIPEVDAGEPQETQPPADRAALAGEPLADKSRLSRRLAVGLMLVLSLVSGFLLVRGIRTPASAPVPSAGEIAVSEASRWQTASDLPQGMWGGAATAYDGRIYLFGGQNADGLLAAAWRFTPKTDQWESLPENPLPFEDVGAVLLGEKIYLPGGCSVDRVPSAVLEIYDLRTGQWAQGAPLPAPRCAAAVTAFEGRLYLFGGWDGAHYADDVWAYDPQTDQWETLTPLETPRAWALAESTALGIHLLGGENAAGALDSHQVYLPVREDSPDGPWRAASPLPRPLARPMGAELANLVYVFDLQTAPAQGWVFYEGEDAWAVLEAAPDALSDGMAIVPMGTSLHFIGGRKFPLTHWVYQAVYVTAIPIIIR
ncbi:MAG: kelch repeat-containing protein [Anaerolineales bacterium]